MPYTTQPDSVLRIPLHAETVLHADGARIDMRLWRGPRGLACRVEYLREGESVICYEGDARDCLRTLRGRNAPYAFRSIEQLRYDFERDMEEIAGGDEAPA